MYPARGRCLVRKVETQETIPGGRILLPESVREGMTGQQVEVVAVGLEPICDDHDCERLHVGCPNGCFDGRRHPCQVASGAWAIVAPRSLVEADEDGLYVIAQDDVLAVIA